MINLDEDLQNADWMRQKWALPPYKSKEFFELLKFNGTTLAHFRTLPVYKHAVKNGVIKGDKWVGPRVS